MTAEIDMTSVLDKMERDLIDGKDRQRCQAVLRMLKRWQWDRDLNQESRERAALLIRNFEQQYD